MEAQRDLPCNGFASIHFEILNLFVKTLSVVNCSSISISAAAAATYILPQFLHCYYLVMKYYFLYSGCLFRVCNRIMVQWFIIGLAIHMLQEW